MECPFISSSRNEMLRVILLLTKALRKSGDTTDDTDGHKAQADDGPNNTPALGGASISLGEDTGVGTIHFA